MDAAAADLDRANLESGADDRFDRPGLDSQTAPSQWRRRTRPADQGRTDSAPPTSIVSGLLRPGRLSGLVHADAVLPWPGSSKRIAARCSRTIGG